MTDPNALRTAAIVQMQATLPKIRELLEGADADLPDYATLAPGVPGLAPFGNLVDAVDRVGYDGQAQNDMLYSTAMFVAALTEIVSAQQERLLELESALSHYRVASAGADT